MKQIPIFIIVHDRVNCLKRAVASFKKYINYKTVIIFHDVASTHKGCLNYLKQMKEKGHTVFRSEVNNHLTVMNSIRTYLKNHPQCNYFIVTDPDIELTPGGRDIIDYYLHLAKAHGNKKVVGPMLKIDDIPDHYPKKRRVVASHRRQFWNKKPTAWKSYKGKTYFIQHSPIDTTFQLVHRSLAHRGFPRAGIRTYAPYDARHLDWYIDPKNMTDDQKYYSNQAKRNISHWGVGI